MARNLKISFLMAVHNEEKILDKSLKQLSKLDYNDYGVLVGLDGCTDGSENVVKGYIAKFPKVFKYFLLSERNGKPSVIDKLVKEASGDIFIIHDADWKFIEKKKGDFKKLISIFDDEGVGGIAESFPIEFDRVGLKKNKSWVFIGTAWANYFWLEFMKKKYCFSKNGKLYVDFSKKGFPFLTNIFRAELYKSNETLGDDFERTMDILSNGKKIYVLENDDLPRMYSIFDKYYWKDLWKQKVRTSLARDQISEKYGLNFGVFNFFIPLFFYMLLNLYKTKSIKASLSVIIWMKLVFVSMIFNLFKKKKSVKEGWLLRAERR